MNKREFATFAAALKTYYPKEQLLPNNKAMELWFRQLEDIPYNIAETALNKWVALNKWSPTIADIRETAASITYGDLPGWGDAWEEVLDAIRRYGSYRIPEAIESLEPLTRQCVDRLGFKNLCSSENIAVERANFRMIYEQMAERKKVDSQIPMNLANMIAGIQQKGIEHNEGKGLLESGQKA